MHSLEERDRWRSADLPRQLWRTGELYVLRQRRRGVPEDVIYRYVTRKQVARLNGTSRERSIVVRRQRIGWCPRTLEGAAVRAVLEGLEFATYNDVAQRVAQWADGDPVGFIARAVADRGALISVLIRLDER